jgi:hypothetical protein
MFNRIRNAVSILSAKEEGRSPSQERIRDFAAGGGGREGASAVRYASRPEVVLEPPTLPLFGARFAKARRVIGI